LHAGENNTPVAQLETVDLRLRSKLLRDSRSESEKDCALRNDRATFD